MISACLEGVLKKEKCRERERKRGRDGKLPFSAGINGPNGNALPVKHSCNVWIVIWLLYMFHIIYRMATLTLKHFYVISNPPAPSYLYQSLFFRCLQMCLHLEWAILLSYLWMLKLMLQYTVIHLSFHYLSNVCLVYISLFHLPSISLKK